MSAYIKLSTLEYPRHVGDIAIDPSGEQDYAHVSFVNPPEINPLTQRYYEIPPIQVDGVWVMQWAVRDLTPEEVEELSNPRDPRFPI